MTNTTENHKFDVYMVLAAPLAHAAAAPWFSAPGSMDSSTAAPIILSVNTLIPNNSLGKFVNSKDCIIFVS